MKTLPTFTYSFRILFLISIALLMSECVATSFESARMLKKGDLEFTGGYARYTVGEDGESEAVSNNISLRAGIGVTDKFNLKMRYARLIPPDSDGDGVNYLALEPKIALLQDYIATSIPIGAYFGDGESEFFTSPKFLFTYPGKNNKFDITLGTRADIFFSEWEVALGFTLGAGFSTDLSKWAIRPEIGYSFDPGESGHLFNWGIGVVYTFNEVW